MRRVLIVLAELAAVAGVYVAVAVAVPVLPWGTFLLTCVTVAGSIAAADRFAVDRRTGLRRRRRRLGQCLHCGYSLRGNVSGICPECGLPASLPVGMT